MLRRATERLLDGGLTAAAFARMDDADLLVALRENEGTEQVARRLSTRELYKRAVWAPMDSVPEHVVDTSHETVRTVERDIGDVADVDPRQVVVDIPARPSIQESTTRVLSAGEMRRLDEASPLVATLRAASREQWRLGVYAPDEHTGRVGRAAESVLDLEADVLVDEPDRPGETTLDEFE